jgi:hypothetical protein
MEEVRKEGKEGITNTSLSCPKHSDQILCYFCEDDNQIICRDCAFLDHRSHQCKTIQSAAQKYRQSVKSTLSETKRIEGFLMEELNLIVNQQETLSSNSALAKKKINEHYLELAKLMKERYRQLLNQVEQIQQTEKKKLDLKQNATEFNLAAVRSSQEFTEQALSEGTDVQWLSITTQIANHLQQQNTEMLTRDVYKATTLDIQFIRPDPATVMDALKDCSAKFVNTKLNPGRGQACAPGASTFSSFFS